MDKLQAQRVIESLRKGIPPDGFVRDLTVGRGAEIKDLISLLKLQDATVLLLKANYGSGKTHLLRFIREEGLGQGYAVSSVTLDSSSAVRFNRMDQILGAVCRNIEVPQSVGYKGIRSLFSLCSETYHKYSKGSLWSEISNEWKWDYSDVLDSPALFVALRAWINGDLLVQNTVEDWLFHPDKYKINRKVLYCQLVNNLRPVFRDPRPDWKFYQDEVFVFDTQAYAQSWAAFRDLNRLSKAAGLKGLVILFDEFEDVITNLEKINYQEKAFWNLFDFYNGKKFPGKSFFAVTPDFVENCKCRLYEKGRFDFDYSRFDELPIYEMSPLDLPELEELSNKIIDVHGIAYQWEPDLVIKASKVKKIVQSGASMPVQDRSRNVIINIVKALDALLPEG